MIEDIKNIDWNQLFDDREHALGSKKFENSSALIFRSKSILLAIRMYQYTGMDKIACYVTVLVLIGGIMVTMGKAAYGTNESSGIRTWEK